MSAECHRCGTDIVYPEGTWPVGVCPVCEPVIDDAMVERAARAMAACEGQDPDHRHPCPWPTPAKWELYAEDARAVLTAALHWTQTPEEGNA